MTRISRRQMLLTGAALSTASILFPSPVQAESKATNAPFRYSLNFGTLLGFKLPIEEEVDLAAKAGYDAIEPWIRGLDAYKKQGKNFADMKKRIEDHGLAVAGACSFFHWAGDDEEIRNRGIEQMKREIELCQGIGCPRIAATAAGVTGKRIDDFKALGERYRTVMEIGDKEGVIPQLEVWGGVKTMGCLSDVVSIAIQSGHPKAELLLDVFHLYKAGDSFDALAMLNGRKMPNFHVNDYPADPPREQAKDADRVYAGDGVAPLKMIFQTLRNIGFNGTLSFEVFNPTYWATNDPLLVARTGLEKMKAIAESL